MLNYFKLPLSFAPERLRADLDQLLPGDWVSHFNTRYYEGDWSGVALRSVGGVANQLYPDPASEKPFADTSLLARCPNIRQILAEFKCPMNSVRLLRLGPGSSIREHKDYNLSFEDGEIGVHIPVVTNSRVSFFLNKELLEMAEGECWYLNLNLPHKVENLGATDRIHLVLHCVVNDWVRAIIPQASASKRESADLLSADSLPRAAAGEREPKDDLSRFRRIVLENLPLQLELREETNKESFIACIVRLGEKHGFSFTAADVEEALRASRRSWAERWI